uniref:Uncharacterized protein n=1 Tax=Anguilla anguilla TaxID=7936 RepID=A0A0E9RIS4_ANGAN
MLHVRYYINEILIILFLSASFTFYVLRDLHCHSGQSISIQCKHFGYLDNNPIELQRK